MAQQKPPDPLDAAIAAAGVSEQRPLIANVQLNASGTRIAMIVVPLDFMPEDCFFMMMALIDLVRQAAIRRQNPASQLVIPK